MPENPERLMALINEHTGSLRQDEFKKATLIESSEKVALGEVFRIHDYNYLSEVIKKCQILKDNELSDVHLRYDRDTVLTEKTWECALLSCGAAIKAAD